MKINKKLAAALGSTLALGTVAAGLAFTATSANAAAAGTPSYCEYDIKKVDESGAPLAGAEFTLQKGSDIYVGGSVLGYATVAEAKAAWAADTDAHAARAAISAAVGSTARNAAIAAYDAAVLTWEKRLPDGHVWTTDANGEFSFVTYCNANAFSSDLTAQELSTRGSAVVDQIVETKAPAGKELAGGLINLSAANPNITVVTQPYESGLNGVSDILPVKIARQTFMTVVDHDYVAPAPSVDPVVAPVVIDSVVKVAASHK